MTRKLVTLEEAVRRIVNKHGGIRAASRATGVDKAFLSRLLNGHKTAPSDDTLNKLGLEAVPLYVVLRDTHSYERAPDQPEGNAW